MRGYVRRPLCMSLSLELTEGLLTALMFGVVLFCFFAMIPSRVFARDITVPDEFDTISEAMEEAEAGDTVYVKPGTYNERIMIPKGVNLVSWAGSDGNELVDGPGIKKVLKRTKRTIIDGSDIEEAGYLVSFGKDTLAPMKLDGFTITNQPKYESGVPMFLLEVRGSNAEVVNNIFSKNLSWGGALTSGLGVGMGPPLETRARPTFRNNVFYDNCGPGIANGPNSSAIIVDNEFFDNHFPGASDATKDAPGIGMREDARPTIENNICYRNGAGIGALNLSSNESPLIIRGNLLFNNRRAGIGLMALVRPGAKTRAIIENNTSWGNLKAGIAASELSQIQASYNTIEKNMKAGIALFNVKDALIEDNQIRANSTTGIRLLNVPLAILRRNHVYQNLTAGIEVYLHERDEEDKSPEVHAGDGKGIDLGWDLDAKSGVADDNKGEAKGKDKNAETGKDVNIAPAPSVPLGRGEQSSTTGASIAGEQPNPGTGADTSSGNKNNQDDDEDDDDDDE